MEKTSNDTYYSLFCKWQVSGMSKAAFAASEGVSKFRFYYWCKKFGGDSVSDEPDSGFTRLSVSGLDFPQVSVRINYPNGVSVELFGSADVERIKALVF